MMTLVPAAPSGCERYGNPPRHDLLIFETVLTNSARKLYDGLPVLRPGSIQGRRWHLAGVAEIVRFPPYVNPRCRKSDDFRYPCF